jgi:hypothetical protein
MRCIHGTWVADGTHQTCIQSPLTIMYLSHRATKALSRRKINWYQVSVTKKRHLASRRHLLQIVGQEGAFQGVQKDGHTTS